MRPFPTWLIFFGAIATVIAQSQSIPNTRYEDCDESQYRTSIRNLTDGNAVGRHLSLATDSPVTRIIRSNPALASAIDPLYDIFHTFDNIMEKRREQNDSLACNLPNTFRYIRNSRKSVTRRQFGNYSEDEVCPSRIDVDIAVQRNELGAEQREEFYDTLRTGLEALYQAASRIDVIPPVNWTRGTFRTFGFRRFQSEQECTIDSLFAYRSQGNFYIRGSVSNWPADISVEDFNRQQINEYVPREGDTALLGPHIRFGSDCVFENSSTQLTRWAGEVPQGHGGNADLNNRFGVFTIASRANSVAVDLAEDSLTASNIAILALPMVMNFVPVAFVADLSTFAMLCYVIFTDMFSTIPFMIKGIELINTGTGMRRAMGALRLGNFTLGQLEIFVADCRGKQSYKTIGIAFVCVALVLMVFGIWLEVYARKVMQRRRSKGEEGPFGDMMDFVVGYGPMGGHTEDEKMRRFTYELIMEEGIGARDRSSGNVESEENSMPSFPSRISTGVMTWMRGESGSGSEERPGNSRRSGQSRKRQETKKSW